MEVIKSPDGGQILNIGSTENRFNPTFLENLTKGLDTIENDKASKALVITASGKFFSNGLDVDWLGKNRDKAGTFISDVWKVLARILVFPIPTVAVINGHGYGAGLFLALACDWRTMRNDRGFLNFPEVNIGLPLSGFRAFLAKLPPRTHRAALTGEKISAGEALAYGIIDAAEKEENLVPSGLQLALKHAGKNRKILTQIKYDLWGSTHDLLVTSTAKL